MADTSAQHNAEKWVAAHFFPERLKGTSFSGRKLTLKWGGQFAFDAVSEDGKIVGLISTSAALTVSGKAAMAKFQKLKADALYLLNVIGAEQLLMIFTEDSMSKHFEKEKKSGRFPPEIIFMHALLPEEIHALVLASRQIASAETSPQGAE
jgi:hypothetical protein